MTSLLQKISEHIWLSSIFIFLLVFSAYSPILNNQFKVIHDSDYIVSNSSIRSFNNLTKAFGLTLFKANLEYRPVVVVSHMVEYYFFGLTPAFYYLVNMLIHLANVFLAYGLMVALIRDRSVALVTCLLFALHPINWEAVSFLSGRPDLLNNFFNLSALTLAVLYLRRLNSWWMVASLLCFALALLSRESREAFVLVFFFYFMFMMRDHEAKGMRWLIFLPYVVVTFLYMGLRQGVVGLHIQTIDAHFRMKIIGVLESVVVQLKELLVPTHTHIHQTAFVGRITGGVCIEILGLVLVILALGTLWHYRKNINGLVFFLVGWLIVGLWPVIQSSFLFEGASHRLLVTDASVYLLIIPFMTLVVLAFRWLLIFLNKNTLLRHITVTVVTVGFITMFFLLTYRNNVQAQNELALLEDAQQLEPPNASLQYSLGLVNEHKNDLQNAQAHFERALIIDPDFLEARLGLGKNFYRQGKLLDAVKIYESIQSPGKYQKVVENNLWATYNVLILSQESIIAKNPQDLSAYFSLGVFYSKVGEILKAISSYQSVIEIDVDNKEGLKNLALKFQGMLYQQVGNVAQAQDNFERAR